MIEVTCAIIERAGMVLVVKRAPGMHLEGFWEFPGGKLLEGETARACIMREISEELSLEVEPGARLAETEHEYPEHAIRLLPFVCAVTGGEVELAEHSEMRWLWPEDLAYIELAPADKFVARTYLSHIK